MKKLNENTQVTLTLGQLKKLVKESGMTIEDAFDQMEQDVRKAKYAYLKGEVEEASNTVFEIIEDAKGISNRLTETTGGALVENSQGLVDQVLENPEVRAAAERFVNRFIEDIAEYEEFDNKLVDYITTGDEFRFKKLKEAIRNVMNNYNGPK